MRTDSDSPQLEQQIRSFVAANLLYSADGFAFADDASFLQEGIVDSLGVMHLVEFVRAGLPPPGGAKRGDAGEF